MIFDSPLQRGEFFYAAPAFAGGYLRKRVKNFVQINIYLLIYFAFHDIIIMYCYILLGFAFAGFRQAANPEAYLHF